MSELRKGGGGGGGFPSEASRMLEAALEQMDGIIQGAKYELPHQFDNIAIQVRGPSDQWLLIRDVYPGSWIRSFPSRIQGQKES
jgi:hypothetical protein